MLSEYLQIYNNLCIMIPALIEKITQQSKDIVTKNKILQDDG